MFTTSFASSIPFDSFSIDSTQNTHSNKTSSHIQQLILKLSKSCHEAYLNTNFKPLSLSLAAAFPCFLPFFQWSHKNIQAWEAEKATYGLEKEKAQKIAQYIFN